MWHDGDLVLSHIKDVEHLGLTGEIKFDSQGFRTDFQMDLMEKNHGRLQKTATWSPESGVNYTLTVTEMGHQIVEKLANKTLKIVTTLVSLYYIIRPLPPDDTLHSTVG